MSRLGSLSVAILAGGLGSRLRPCVADRPKVLAEVAGRPFVTYLLERILGAGGRHVVLCTGYRGEQVEALLGRRYGRLRLEYSREETRLDTGGALRLALPRLASDPVLVLNGDSLSRVPLARVAAHHERAGRAISLALVRVAESARYGRVELDAAGRVVRFAEKGEAGPGWISAGIYVMTRRVIASVPAGRPCSLERELFPAWIGKGLVGCPCAGELLDIGTPAAYRRAARTLAAWRAEGRATGRGDRRVA